MSRMRPSLIALGSVVFVALLAGCISPAPIPTPQPYRRSAESEPTTERRETVERAIPEERTVPEKRESVPDPAPPAKVRSDQTVVVRLDPGPEPERGALPVGTRGDFGRIDGIARTVPSEHERSVGTLSAYLREHSRSQWELTRAVYIWMTAEIAYDTDSYFSGRRSTYDAAGVLRTRMSVCEGYSRLFLAIGRAAGLTVEQVTGYAKGYGHRTGQAVTGTNHAWNRVEIGGEWYLFDSTWGAGHVDGRRFVRSYDEFFFAPKPAEFIFSHLPVDPAHQYLAEPVGAAAFSRLPEIEESLFLMGLNAEALLRHIQRGGEYVAPQGYSAARVGLRSVRAIDIPWDGRLRAGETYRFEFELDPILPAAIIHNGQFTYMESNGGVVSAVIRPRRGSLAFAVQPDASRRSYHYVMEWRVE
jgi:hypothetical protein